MESNFYYTEIFPKSKLYVLIKGKQTTFGLIGKKSVKIRKTPCRMDEIGV